MSLSEEERQSLVKPIEGIQLDESIIVELKNKTEITKI